MNKILLALLLVSTVTIAKNRIELVEQSDLGANKEMLEEDKRKDEEKKIKGYYTTESSYPKFLLSAKLRAKNEIANFKNEQGVDDTYLKGSIKDIHLAWRYDGIKTNIVSPKDVIAFAAIGMFVTNKGWTGVKEIFSQEYIGICEYSISNMELANGEVKANKNTAKYFINNKLSSISVFGNKQQGFSYRVYWYDNTFAHELQCANQVYDKKITDRVIALAKTIDNSR